MRRLYLAGALLVMTSMRSAGAPLQADGALQATLRRALTFHASFDKGADADFGSGDRKIYTGTSFEVREDAKPGIGNPDVVLAKGQGRYGDALQFRRKNTQAIYFRAAGNVPFSQNGWNGTVSFWLNLSPDTDLEPGYSDPIQITDKTYNNAAIWVDFTRDDKPRHFRLGVFGDLKSWNPENLPPEKNPFFDRRTIVVSQPPFTRGQWTQVVITHAGLNTAEGGTAKLYLDGRLQGTAADIREPFTWNVAQATIRIGVNYVGLWDELSVFDRALSAEEVGALYELKGGVASLHE